MEKENKAYRAHVLAIPYPSQGHINPMLQFSKCLVSKGIKATLATTLFISKSIKPETGGLVQLDTISDGYDDGGFMEAESIGAYLARLEAVGSETLTELIIKHKNLGHPIHCILYDAFLPWALDVAHQFGLVGAVFFTQTCAVNYIYYCVHHGLLKLPITSTPILIPGLPPLERQDMPSFIYVPGSYPAYFDMVLNQFSNADKADCMLVNTFYKLEDEVVDTMSEVCPLLTIGPTIPSQHLDFNRIENDKDYGLHLFTLNPSAACTTWLRTKPKGSVVYVSFGSMANLVEEQMEELAWGLKASNCYFLWVVREWEEAKIPKGFAQEMADKCLLVNWSFQLEVLASEAVGCFFTHCGWNSTVEALSLGVPMVGMPQWTDQTTDAKFMEDVWKVGIRVKVDKNGIVRREEIEFCIREVMEGERGKELNKNAIKWKELAREAVSEGGTTDRNIDEFVSKLITS